MEKITIAGAGISGLTAAINLAKKGYNVDINERTNHCGGRFNGYFQYLENWTSEKDVLDVLRDINIDINFKYIPIKSLELYSPSLHKAELKTKKPLLYFVKRGSKDSIDTALGKQAVKAGVDIKYNSNINRKKADIISTGPAKITGLAIGIRFRTNAKNRILVLFNDNIAPKSYAYLAIVNKEATLATSMFKDFENSKYYLEKTIAEFKKIMSFEIKSPQKFSGYDHIFSSNSATLDGKLLTGEAAGFQDHLAGFGMRYAFLSGYFAAKSIADKENYDELWKKTFLNQWKTGISNKLLFDMLGNPGYSLALRFHRLLVKDFQKVLRKNYNSSLLKKIIYPVAKMHCKI